MKDIDIEKDAALRAKIAGSAKSESLVAFVKSPEAKNINVNFVIGSIELWKKTLDYHRS